MSYCTQNVPLRISLKAISPMFYLRVPLVPVWHKDIHIVIFCFFSSPTVRMKSPPMTRRSNRHRERRLTSNSEVSFVQPPSRRTCGDKDKLKRTVTEKRSQCKPLLSSEKCHIVPTVHKAAGRKFMVLEDHFLLLQNTAKLHYRQMPRNP